MRREERIAGRERGIAYTYFVRHQATSPFRYHSLTLHDEQANATIESRILPWDTLIRLQTSSAWKGSFVPTRLRH